MKLAPTPFAARQIVNHGHVLVNGKRVNIASYQLSDGDTIELRQKAKEMALVLEAAQSSERDVHERHLLCLLSQLDRVAVRSEEHTSELQSQSNLVCRLLL